MITTTEMIRIVFIIIALAALVWVLYLFLFDWNKDELVRTGQKNKGVDKPKPVKAAEDYEVQIAQSEDVKTEVTAAEASINKESTAANLDPATRPEHDYVGRGRLNDDEEYDDHVAEESVEQESTQSSATDTTEVVESPSSDTVKEPKLLEEHADHGRKAYDLEDDFLNKG